MRKKRAFYYLFAVLLLSAMVLLPARAQANRPASIEPVIVSGNPSCEDLGYDFGYKVDPPGSGTYSITPSYWVSVTADGTYFDWSSNLGMDAVIAKGGPDANLYIYDPEATSDTGLHSPINANTNMPFGLSHIEFCYDYELDVSKSAQTSFTRTYNWTIDKSVTPEAWDLFTGDSGTSLYTITVSKTGYTDSDWGVSGGIMIENNTPLPATIESVVDVVSGIGGVPVNCGVTFPYLLAAGGTLNCSYASPLPDSASRTNTATVTTSGNVGGGEASAAVDFGSATISEVNASIHVDDTNGGTWLFSDSGSVSYSKTFTCGADQGAHMNTATIRETEQSDDATVTVNCHALTVTKDAHTSLTRTWNWTIDKSVSPATWDLFTGDSGTSQYTVAVTKTGYTDSGWGVSGNIAVFNPAPIAATINGVADVVSPDIAAGVNCEVTFPYTLVAGGTLNCSYSASLPDGSSRLNTATATLQNYDYDKDLNATPSGTSTFSGQANAGFGNAVVTEVNTSIHVDDTNGGSWLFNDSGSVSYTRTFSCGCDEGTHDNTATIRETDQSDDASVTVNCHALNVTKDAYPWFTRTYHWTIDKWADQTALTLSIGQQFQVNYSVMVNASYIDSLWGVSGNITVDNPAPIPATINSVTDVVSPDIAAVVDCGVSFPYALAAGGTLHCNYSASLPDSTSRTNTAIATLQNYDYDKDLNATPSGTSAFSGQANVDFSSAVLNEIDECIVVYDTYAGLLGTVCYPDVPRTFTYSRWTDPYYECGTYQVDNTASFITNDSGSTGSDSWTVIVDVPCVGCTLTPGYWKTHSEFGPAPYDETWALLPFGARTPFYLSGQTYYEVLWTPPQGNAYYILAHAYIAARLNVLNGAESSPVNAALDWAEDFFNDYLPTDRLHKDVRKEALYYASLLDQYNNGLIGPGHCSE